MIISIKLIKMCALFVFSMTLNVCFGQEPKTVTLSLLNKTTETLTFRAHTPTGYIIPESELALTPATELAEFTAEVGGTVAVLARDEEICRLTIRDDHRGRLLAVDSPGSTRGATFYSPSISGTPPTKYEPL